METKSLWQETTHKSTPSELIANNNSCDVVIIGGGITGLTTAILLEKSGKSVFLIDAGTIGNGTTGFSSCHLTTDSDYQYNEIIQSYGKKVAENVALARIEAIDLIEENVSKYSIDCNFQRLNGYYYTENNQDLKEIQKEYEAALSIGLKVSKSKAIPINFPIKDSVVFENQAQINSQKYLNGLKEFLETTDCKIFENSKVTDVSKEENKYIITAENFKINAQSVIMATHYPLFINVLQTMAAPYRSYVIAAKLKDGNYPTGLFWDTHDPYYYTRTYDNGVEKWIVVGGEDHKTGDIEDEKSCFDKLINYTKNHFNVESISFQWSSQYYEPVDGLPFIGKSPFAENLLVATGFSGDGLVYGTVAAKILSDLIKNQESKFYEIFDSTRVNIVDSAKDFVKENLNVAKHFITDRIINHDLTFDDVNVNEGKILEISGIKYAVCRDINNEVHILSPVCPHLSCFVKWNNSERSWDCPCHGSRFSITGEVLTGPAVKNLEKKNFSN